MARIASDPNYSSPTFPRATAGTDLFLKEDVQALAAAVSTHDHSTGKGVALTAGAIPNGTITSAMIADGTIDSTDLKDGSVTSAKILDGTIATADIAALQITQVLQTQGSAGQLTTTSASSVDISDLSINITTTGGPVLIILTVTCSHSSSGALATLAVNVDGGADVGLAQISAPGANYYMEPHSIIVYGGLSAGAHTLKGRWSTSGGTLTAQGNFRKLIAVEFKR